MAGPIGTVVVRIGADLSELQNGVRNAQGQLGKLGTGMRKGINVAGKYAAAMAIAGAAVTAALVTKAFSAIDAQAKLARQLRASNAGLETLTRAASLSGIEQTKMVGAVRKLDVAIGESIRGTATYKDAFDKLGLSAKQVSEMDADERIKAINQALMENVPAAERAQVAGVLFGNRVGAAVASIDAGTLARAREEVEALGLAVSEVDSRTIERLNDDFSTLREVFRGFINRVAVKLAPIVAAIAEHFKSAAIEARGFEGQIESAFKGAMKAAGFFGDVIHGLRVTFKGLELIVNGFGAVVASVFEMAVKGIFSFASEVNKSINFIIEGMNKIPNVKIDLLETDINTVGAVKFVSTLGEAMREKVGETRAELHDLAMQELPSSKIEKFIQTVEAASRAASEAAVKASADIQATEVVVQKALERLDPKSAIKSISSTSGELDEQVRLEKETEQYRESLTAKLDALREHMMTESELETERHQQRFEILQENLEAELITEGEYQKLKEEMELQHQARMGDIEKDGLTQRQRFEQMSMKQKAKTISGELANITAGVAQHNRKLFELNKAAGIANAIVNAFEGISLTLKTYPYPLNLGMAAAHAVSAFAQISAIKSASFGSGAAPSIAGSTPASPVTPVTSGAPSSAGQLIRIEGRGSTFTTDQVRELIEQINESLGDGSRLTFA